MHTTMKKIYIAPCLIDNTAMEAEQLLAGSPQGILDSSQENQITSESDFGSRQNQGIWDDGFDE